MTELNESICWSKNKSELKFKFKTKNDDLKKQFTHFTFIMTPVGCPTDTLATTELYFETFFSAPYSAI